MRLGANMSALQFVTRAEIRPGDRVREVGSLASVDQMPVVARLDDRAGAFVNDGAGERFVPFARVEAVLRVIRVSR